jgi:hypothetical protein
MVISWVVMDIVFYKLAVIIYHGKRDYLEMSGSDST